MADALSRLPPQVEQGDESLSKQASSTTKTKQTINPSTIFCIGEIPPVANQHNLEFYGPTMDNTQPIENDDKVGSFMNLPLVDHEHPFVLEYSHIKEQQDQDADLQAALANNDKLIMMQMSADTTLICYRSAPDAEPKIYIPASMLEALVQWYHEILNHPGMNRLFDSINAHMHNPRLRATCESVVSTCDTCQRFKLPGRGYGETPPRTALVAPWHEVAVDLIGPWKIKVPGYDEAVVFNALTAIDTVTNLTELIRINRKTSRHVALAFQNSWLTRYPRPIHVIYDQGGEFTGGAFQNTINRLGIRRHPTSVKNAQANAICERMHQTVGNILRTLLYVNPPANLDDANLLLDTALASASHAIRTVAHNTLRMAPGAMVFRRDMFLDIPLEADFVQLNERRQAMIDRNLLAANNKRRTYDYKVGDEVLKIIPDPSKLDPRAEGPYTVVTVHVNGTLTIRLTPQVHERINIRRVKPYRR